MQRNAPTPATPPRRRILLLAAGASVLALVGAAAIIWLVWFSSAAPAPASLDEAVGAVGSASPGASAAADASPSATVDASAGPSAEPAAEGVDGSWTVDTSIGSFADYTSSFAGFRVDEVLSSIGSTTAIGRTPNVTGELTIAGGTLTAGTIEVDLTTIRSDQSRRDPAIQRALETGSFPTASFTLTSPVSLPDGAAAGEQVTVAAAGELTIHGVSRPVELTLEASLVDDVIVAVGSIDVTFTEFGVVMPTAPVVVSVEEHGQIEFQLFFSRG